MIRFSIMMLCFTATYVVANEMKFHYYVSEGKARFLQEIETDLLKETVKYHTPAHNNVLETYLLQDFKKGLQMTCFPSLQECRLRDIDRTIHPPAGNVTESFLHSWNKGINSISSENSKVISERYFVDEEVLNTVALGQELQNFLHSFGFPLLKESKLPANVTLYPIIESKVHVQKREKIPNSLSCSESSATLRYGFTPLSHCHYLKVCGDRILEMTSSFLSFSNCGNKHITYPMAYQCLCCPPVPRAIDLSKPEECMCTKMGSTGK